jgi:hypothetical protein
VSPSELSACHPAAECDRLLSTQTQRDAFSAPRRVHNAVDDAAMATASPASSVDELRHHLSRMQHDRDAAVASQVGPPLRL